MKKIISFLAMTAMIMAVSCKPDNEGSKSGKNGKETKEPAISIKIDGDFTDWANLKADVFASAKNNPNSPWDAVSEIRCCADADFVYYYIRFDKDVLKEQMENNEALPIRLCINTDGEFTSGYASYFLEAYDFIIEGPLADAAGAWGDYDGTLHQPVNGSWSELLKPGSNLVAGKGAGNEYEILLAREIFNNAVPADQKMGDEFYTGIRFYGNGGWGELSNMPNSSTEEGDGNGWGHLIKVTTVK